MGSQHNLQSAYAYTLTENRRAIEQFHLYYLVIKRVSELSWAKYVLFRSVFVSGKERFVFTGGIGIDMLL